MLVEDYKTMYSTDSTWISGSFTCMIFFMQNVHACEGSSHDKLLCQNQPGPYPRARVRQVHHVTCPDSSMPPIKERRAGMMAGRCDITEMTNKWNKQGGMKSHLIVFLFWSHTKSMVWYLQYSMVSMLIVRVPLKVQNINYSTLCWIEKSHISIFK